MSVPQYGMPERPGVDGDRHVGLQRLPARLHVSRPEESAVTLHAGGAIAMERERTFVRAPLLRTFPVHPMPNEARRQVEAIALIGPPAVDAEVVERLVVGPVAGDVAILGPAILGIAPARHGVGRRAGLGHRPRHAAPLDDDVEDHLEVLGVHLVHHAFGFGKVLLLPPELAVARVPARGRELGAEIDERVARQLLLAERLRDGQDLVRPGERPVRLHVAERPLRGQFRQAGDACVFAHDHERVA